MKKKLKCYVFAVLFFGVSTEVWGQKEIRNLSIGDEMPNVELRQIINFAKPNGRISDFRGKALIINFWATWCSPCVNAFSRIDSFQEKFKDDLQILPVTEENAKTVSQLLNNLKRIQGVSISSVVEDSILHRLFNHRIIPHYVWIDSNGKVKAITGASEMTEHNIQHFIKEKRIELPLKKDNQSYNWNAPIISGKQVKIDDNDLMYQSLMTKYIQGVPAMSSLKVNHITCTNHSILHLYKIAFGEFDFSYLGNNSKIILEGFKDRNDSLMIGYYTDQTKALWKEMFPLNAYTYELVFLDTFVSNKTKIRMMQQDLNGFFSVKGIQGRVEKRKMKVIALVRTSSKDKIVSKCKQSVNSHTKYSIRIENLSISWLITWLRKYNIGGGARPIINKTNYHEEVDILINCDLSDIKEVNVELEKYDLQLIEEYEETNVIIITRSDK